MSNEELCDEIRKIETDVSQKIKCVILGLQNATAYSGEDGMSICDECTSAGLQYALHRVDETGSRESIRWKVLKSAYVKDRWQVHYGPPEATDVFETLTRHGYAAETILNAIPDDGSLLPFVRYAHLVAPPPSPRDEV